MSDFGEGDEQSGTFSIFFAEGEMLAKQGQYKKAIQSFTKALQFTPEDCSCLVARSKCHLQLGDAAAALEDAEASLKENKKYHKGLFQKAEALYSMGNFEHALMFYHRGHKIRPELHEFTLGIQKAQEAINNNIGSPAGCTLEKVGDLSFFQQEDSLSKKKTKRAMKAGAKGGQAKAKGERKPVASEKTVKSLLGELYADREYLDKLMKDPGLVIGQKDMSIYRTVDGALSYLDGRIEFWRQQKPMYARKRESELKRYRPSPTRPRSIGGPASGRSSHTTFVLKALEDIDNALTEGNAEGSLKQAEEVMKLVLSLSEQDLPSKQEFVASLHSYIGNSQLELGEGEAALKSHLADLRIAEECNFADARSRALDNIGRVYSILGDYESAAKYWELKLPLVQTEEESAWLHHELGRCHLEMENNDRAKELGEKSLVAAQGTCDQMWQLNASVLIAQAETKLGELQSALQSFDRSLDLARLLEDEPSQLAIKKAIEEVNARVAGDLSTEDAPQSSVAAQEVLAN